MFIQGRKHGSMRGDLLAAVVLCTALIALPALSLVHTWSHTRNADGTTHAAHQHANRHHNARAHEAADAEHNHDHDDPHEDHDPSTCKTCLDLLLVKLTTALTGVTAVTFAVDWRAATDPVSSGAPVRRSTLASLPRGPPTPLIL